MREIDTILHAYVEGLSASGETVSRLCELVNRDSVERLSGKLPNRIREGAERHGLGLTARDFNAQRWCRLWECLIDMNPVKATVHYSPEHPSAWYIPDDFDRRLAEHLSVVLERGRRFCVEIPMLTQVFLTMRAPVTIALETILPERLELVTMRDVYRDTMVAYCMPADFNGLQWRFVPEEYRAEEQCAGYYFCIPVADLEANCRPLVDSA